MPGTMTFLRARAAAALIAVTLIPAQAAASQFHTEYSIVALGLKIGTSAFKTKVDGSTYTVEGSLRAAGIASLFTDTSGSLSVTGNLDANAITSRGFDVRYTEGKQSKRTTISFSGGNVSKATNKPVTKKTGKWVELNNAHLSGVLDPISATMVPAKSMRDVCSKTLRIFDGAMRADFPMRYLRTVPFSAQGYKGDAVTCRARFKPLGGYDANKQDVIWMRDNGYADISFAPVGDTGLYAPVGAKIKTRAVTLSIRATRFERLTN